MLFLGTDCFTITRIRYVMPYANYIRFNTCATSSILKFWRNDASAIVFGKANSPLKWGNNPTTPNFHLNSILKKIWISRDLVIKLLIVWTSIFRTHSVAIFTTFFPTGFLYYVDLSFILEKLIKNTSSCTQAASWMYLWFLFDRVARARWALFSSTSALARARHDVCWNFCSSLATSRTGKLRLRSALRQLFSRQLCCRAASQFLKPWQPALTIWLGGAPLGRLLI